MSPKKLAFISRRSRSALALFPDRGSIMNAVRRCGVVTLMEPR
jgi:hypothetical protein